MQVGLRRGVLAAACVAEATIAAAFYFRPEFAFGLLGRPLLDPVISRQYGLFLFSVALFYAILSTSQASCRRLIWIGVVQRIAELVVAVIDWRAGALPGGSFAFVAVAEVVAGVALAACARGNETTQTERVPRTPVDAWLARALIAFGGLQLFWALLSTLFVQLGARLLGWKLQDPYTTQQQGIALLVIGLTSVLAASDVQRYRRFIWIPVSSQAFGVANAVNELRLGSISPTVALIQWAIEACIIAILLSLSSIEHGAVSAFTYRPRTPDSQNQGRGSELSSRLAP